MRAAEERGRAECNRGSPPRRQQKREKRNVCVKQSRSPLAYGLCLCWSLFFPRARAEETFCRRARERAMLHDSMKDKKNWWVSRHNTARKQTSKQEDRKPRQHCCQTSFLPYCCCCITKTLHWVRVQAAAAAATAAVIDEEAGHMKWCNPSPPQPPLIHPPPPPLPPLLPAPPLRPSACLALVVARRLDGVPGGSAAGRAVLCDWGLWG